MSPSACSSVVGTPYMPRARRWKPGEVGDNRLLQVHLRPIARRDGDRDARGVARRVHGLSARRLMHVEMTLAVDRREHLEAHVLDPVEGAHQYAGLVAVTDRVDAAVLRGSAMQQPTDRGVDLGIDRHDLAPRPQRGEHHLCSVVDGARRLDEHIQLIEHDGEVGIGDDGRPLRHDGLASTVSLCATITSEGSRPEADTCRRHGRPYDSRSPPVGTRRDGRAGAPGRGRRSPPADDPDLQRSLTRARRRTASRWSRRGSVRVATRRGTVGVGEQSQPAVVSDEACAAGPDPRAPHPPRGGPHPPTRVATSCHRYGATGLRRPR